MDDISECADVARATRAALVIFDAYLGVLYRWVSDEHGHHAIEDDFIAALDLILTGMNREAPGPAEDQPRAR